MNSVWVVNDSGIVSLYHEENDARCHWLGLVDKVRNNTYFCEASGLQTEVRMIEEEDGYHRCSFSVLDRYNRYQETESVSYHMQYIN